MTHETQPGAIGRVFSVDAFRALTMLLMIWVNDFWSLTDIPAWLQHQAAEDDALGFSDVIFPAFLFIVGLSIPFALSGRINQGESTLSILRHILQRTFALLVMGFFMVNLENMAWEKMVIGKNGWQLLMAFSFVLIWNTYPKESRFHRLFNGLKILGYALLLVLAVFYQGTGDPVTWMKPHWWGILGLIGWSYLLASLIYLFWGSHWPAIAAAWAFFVLFNIASLAGFLEIFSGIRTYVWIVGEGSLPALTMAGVFVSTLYLRRPETARSRNFIWLLLVLGVLVLATGFAVRPVAGISKIRGTPAWTEICTGLSILSYALLYWLIDLRGHKNWARVMEPAGTATLTCYLVPYFVYPLIVLTGISLPVYLTTGLTGLVKSMCFAFLIVWITGLLNRLRIRLKV